MDETGDHEPTDPSSLTARTSSRSRVESLLITGIFVLAVSYTLHYAREILMPVTASAILALLLLPIVRGLRRVRVPEPVAAGIVVFGMFVSLSIGIYFLSDPAAKWMSQMPDMVSEVQAKLKAPIAEIKDVKEEVENIVKETRGDAADPPDAPPKKAAEPMAELQKAPPAPAGVSLLDVFTQTFLVMRDVGWSAVIIVVMLYFLLATGTMFRENVILALPAWRDKRRALEIARDIERDMSTYLGTVILVNLGLGVAIGLAMHLIGLPNAILWGVMAMLLNFIPYLGAVAGSAIVAIVGVVTFDTPVEALLPPAVYIAINALEAYVVTPSILSRRLTINPIAVFLSVIFWGWMWGVPGALMAVPILTCTKVICDATERLAPVSQFLSGRRSR